ncbi:MAG: uracil phosphoribosyltransferase [Pseudomonadota bacterium]
MTNFSNLTVVEHPLLQHKVGLLRDRRTPSALFRQLVREIGLLLGFAALADVPTVKTKIETPLTVTEVPTVVGSQLVFVSIMRAGNGLLDGLLDLVPHARAGHIGLARDEQSLQADEYYFKLPENLNRQALVLLADPMLATANSAIHAVTRLKREGLTQLRMMCVLAAPEGVRAFEAAHPDVSIFTAALDSHLDERGFIVPGLGDAGDRIYDS